MLATDDSFPPPAEGHQSGMGGLGLSDIRWILRRAWWLPLLGLLIGLALAVGFIVIAPEVYRSSARILLDRSVNRYLQSNKIADEPTLDDTDIGSQIYVLSSDSIVVPVVQSLKLTSDPEFVGRPDARGGWGLKKLVDLARQSIVSFKPQVASLGSSETPARFDATNGVPGIDPNTVLERTAVETLLRQLTVFREDAPNVINITFASEDPIKAANVANALADTYIANIEERKAKSTKMISQLLEDRLLELKRQADDADRALQEFIVTHNLVGTGVGRIPPTTNDGTLANPPTANNELIVKLRAQYVDLAAKASELEGQLGPTHLAVVKLHNQMDQLNAAIRNEDQRNGLSEEDQAKLRELESSAATLHGLYSSSLRKFSEVNQVQPDTEEAHIITRAAPPLYKSNKKSILVLCGGLAFGLLSGIGAAIGREWLAGVFRTPAQVREATGLYCATLPTIETRRHAGGLEDYVLDAPYTRFTETIRNVRASITADQRIRGSKIIAVVSSVSNEGKTTVVNNLAALLSASSISRTLVIDCDLHRRTVTSALAPNATEGLIEALADPTRLESLVLRRERSGAYVLPCAISERSPNAAELLGSPQMKQLLAAASEKFDFIIVEVAPIMSVVDIKIIERFVDGFIFVVEWGKTKRSLVEEALSEADMIRDRILCVLLNKANPAALRSIEAYKGPRIADYYVG